MNSLTLGFKPFLLVGRVESRFKHQSPFLPKESLAWILPGALLREKSRNEFLLFHNGKVKPQTECCTQGHREKQQNWEQNPHLLLPKPQTFPSAFPTGVPACAILSWLLRWARRCLWDPHGIACRLPGEAGRTPRGLSSAWVKKGKKNMSHTYPALALSLPPQEER